MASHSSATTRSETPNLNADIKQRVQSLINHIALDAGTRNILRYALEIDDPCLPDLVRRIDAGETIIDDQGFLQIEEEKSVQ